MSVEVELMLTEREITAAKGYIAAGKAKRQKSKKAKT
jgi:hypothetical protein